MLFYYFLNLDFGMPLIHSEKYTGLGKCSGTAQLQLKRASYQIEILAISCIFSYFPDYVIGQFLDGTLQNATVLQTNAYV